MTKDFDSHLVTAGGNIFCRRCRARSSRTKLQCGRAALKGKQVCQFHGGRSTGPKTEAGKARLRTLNLKDGQFTRAMTLASSGLRLQLRYLEDIAIHIGMFKQRTSGPKPFGYCKLDLRDRQQFLLACWLAGLSMPKGCPTKASSVRSRRAPLLNGQWAACPSG